jgi:hypothetical protein
MQDHQDLPGDLTMSPSPEKGGTCTPAADHPDEMEIARFTSPTAELVVLLLSSSLADSASQPPVASQNIAANSPLLTAPTSPDHQARTGSALTSAPPAARLEHRAACTAQPDFQWVRCCFANQERSLMRLCNAFDEANSPLCLCDKMIAQLKLEMSMNDFNPRNPSLTKRNLLMTRTQVPQSIPQGNHGAVRIIRRSSNHLQV